MGQHHIHDTLALAQRLLRTAHELTAFVGKHHIYDPLALAQRLLRTSYVLTAYYNDSNNAMASERYAFFSCLANAACELECLNK